MWIDELGAILEALLGGVLERFVAPGSTFAAGLAIILIGIAVAIILIQALTRILPTWLALNIRCGIIARALAGATTAEDRHRQFARNYSELIDPAMSAGFDRPLSQWTRRVLVWLGVETPLRLAWSELKETFIDESEQDVIRNTARPQGYILHAVGNPASWGWLSGFFVSLGLLFTFVGIVAVLDVSATAISETASQSAGGADEGGGVGDIQDAIIQIVAGASSKFYASIGGIFAAILLRFFVSIFTGLIRQRVERLSDLIESGLSYVPEQRLIVEQLNQLTEQTVQLKMFNTDLAVTIGDRFDQAISPVAARLGDIQTSLEQQSERTMQVLGEGVGQAIDNIAGGELRELGRVLGDLKGELAGMSSKLSAGGDAAAQQLELAASKLKDVSGGFQAEFERIASRLNELSEQQSDRVTGTMDSLVRASEQATAGISGGVTDAVAKLAGSMNETIEQLNAAGERNAQTHEAMATALSSLTADIGKDARQKMGEAFGVAADESRKAAAEAAEAMKAAYNQASQDWVAALDGSVRKMGDLGAGFESAGLAVSTHAQAMTKAAGDTKSAADALARSATGLERIASPIETAAAELQSAAGEVKSAVESLSSSAKTAIDRAQFLADGMSATAEAAGTAWSSYQNRFGQVDEDLERVLSQMSDALDQNAKRLTEYVSQVDGQLAKAVENLAGVVKPLTELADELEAAVQNIQSAARQDPS